MNMLTQTDWWKLHLCTHTVKRPFNVHTTKVEEQIRIEFIIIGLVIGYVANLYSRLDGRLKCLGFTVFNLFLC